jgi:hypothetical protein
MKEINFDLTKYGEIGIEMFNYLSFYEKMNKLKSEEDIEDFIKVLVKYSSNNNITPIERFYWLGNLVRSVVDYNLV